jgi:hypothetical protein
MYHTARQVPGAGIAAPRATKDFGGCKCEGCGRWDRLARAKEIVLANLDGVYLCEYCWVVRGLRPKDFRNVGPTPQVLQKTP